MELSITNEELEKMIANVEWSSDEDTDLEEPRDNLSVSLNAKVSALKLRVKHTLRTTT